MNFLDEFSLKHLHIILSKFILNILVATLEGLADKVQEGFIYEAAKHQFNLPQISSTEIKCIVNTLESMKFEISKRIVTID